MRRIHPAPVVFAGALAVVLCSAAPSTAHEHPSGITDLVTPALVWVEAEAKVDITLLDHVGDLIHVERSYDVPIGKGTGVVVTPEGAVVTLTEIVTSDRDIAVHAANKIFAEHHKVRIDDDFDRHKLDDPVLNRHLQQCYPPKRPTATCIIDVTTEITVYPNISTGDREGFKAEIVHTGDRGTAPAVLTPINRADGSVGLPTAPLADQVPGQEGAPVSVAGFTGRPSDKLRHMIDIAHLGKGGAGEDGRPFKDPEGKVDEPPKLGGLADKGLLGAPVIGDKDGSVVGLLVGGGKEGRMIGIREAIKALGEAKIVPRRGPIDSAFEVALTRFHNNYYTDAVPAFQRVLELYPGHAVAAEHLKTAQEKRGGPEDAALKNEPVTGGGGEEVPLWPFIAAGVVLVAALLAGPLLLWRRRTPEEPEPETPQIPETLQDAPPKPVPVSPVTPQSPPQRRMPVGAPVPGDAITGPRRPIDDSADATIVVGRPKSFPPIPVVPAKGEPVRRARPDATTGPGSLPEAAPAREKTPEERPDGTPVPTSVPTSVSTPVPTPEPESVPGSTPGSGSETGSTTGPRQTVGSVTGPKPSADSPSDRQPSANSVTGPRPAVTAVPGPKPIQKFCTQCGMNLGPAHKFCGYCGHPVET